MQHRLGVFVDLGICLPMINLDVLDMSTVSTPYTTITPVSSNVPPHIVCLEMKLWQCLLGRAPVICHDFFLLLLESLSLRDLSIITSSLSQGNARGLTGTAQQVLVESIA